MFEVIVPDAVKEAVAEYNAAQASINTMAMQPLEFLQPVDWEDATFGEGEQVSRLFAEQPSDSEVEDLMNVLGATAAMVRLVQIPSEIAGMGQRLDRGFHLDS
jgi:hypothetical protein